jgi:Flp pilus assembly pilin Flp
MSIRRQRGQGLVEYAIILVLLAIGTMGLVGIFGDNIREVFGASAQSLAGETVVLNNGEQNPEARKTMANFGEYNSSGTK